tara:strand:+ start:38 stop:748 length:711 start_codon:yes stop_codon:yes gene_type:complete
MSVSTESLYINMNDVSNILTKVAISSQFKVSLNLNRNTGDQDLLSYLTRCGIFDSVDSTGESYDFLCSQAALPSSQLFYGEERGSRQGTIERFPTFRVYDMFGLTFYVDRDYNVVRLFEEWVNYINPIYDTTGRYEGQKQGQLNTYRDRSSHYRLRYPDSYKRDISITKFERDLVRNPNDPNSILNNVPLLTYRFIDCFPESINTVPLTYEGSTVLELTVNFMFLRHTVEKHLSEV